MSSISMKWKLTLAAASLLSVAGVASFAAVWLTGGSTVERATRTVYRPVEFEADRLFPMETLGDVALRADAIVLGTPIAEVELEDPEVIGRGEATWADALPFR